MGKAKLKAGSLETFVSSQEKKDKLFPFALAVYGKIRSTGRQVLPFMKGIKYLRVYAPGVGRLEERPSQLICLLPGKEPSAKTLVEEVKIAHLARLDLIIAIGGGSVMGLVETILLTGTAWVLVLMPLNSVHLVKHRIVLWLCAAGFPLIVQAVLFRQSASPFLYFRF